MMAKTLADLIAEARAEIGEIQPDELEALIEGGGNPLLVDVREADEHRAGRIPDSVLIPRGLLEGAADPNNKHRRAALCTARQRTVVLYCDTGARSALATRTLLRMGFAHPLNLAGGIELWAAEDLPIEADDTGR